MTIDLSNIPTLNNLVCLCGERRTGKDYLTNHLVNKYGAKRMAFGDEVRVLAQQLHPWFNAYMDDDQKDSAYSHPINTNGLTGREIILSVAKVREVDSKYFVRSFIKNQLQSAIDNPTQLHVITDLRVMKDEYYDFLKPLNIPVIKIERNTGLPVHPFEVDIRDFRGDYTFLNYYDGVELFDASFLRFAKDERIEVSYGLV